MTSTSAAENLCDPEALAASDAAAFAWLDTAFGDTLPEILGRYVAESDRLAEALRDASSCAHWQAAVSLALKIGHEADEMGFHRVAKTARAFADAAYHADSPHHLRNDAQMVVFEYERFRLALELRYPNLVASVMGSVA